MNEEVEVMFYRSDGSKVVAHGRARSEPVWEYNWNQISMRIYFDNEVRWREIPAPRPKRTWASSMGLRKPKADDAD